MTATDPGTKPTAPPVEVEYIPDEMKAEKRWVCWRYAVRDGRWTKVPMNPANGHNASSANPRTWGSFDKAAAYYRTNPVRPDGIGFMLGHGWVGIDIDNCLDDEGKPSEMAAAIVAKLDTYTEVSPSGKGLKLIGRAVARLPRGKGAKESKLGLEVYNSGRFFTVTGRRYHGRDAVAVGAAVTWLYDTYLPHKREQKKAAPPPPTRPVDKSDEELVRLIRDKPKYAALWGGLVPAGKSQSEADLALMNRIVFFTGNDPDRADRIFRSSSLGKRSKWQTRPDYRDATIAKALAGKTKFYNPGPKRVFSQNGDGKHHEQNGNASAKFAEATGTAPPSSASPNFGEAAGPRCGWEIIRDYFQARYGSGYRVGDAVYVNRDRREVRRQEAVSALPPDLITPLALAANAPTFKGGAVNVDALPGFFKKWAGTAWVAFLATLPDEDGATDGAVEVAADEFRRLVRQAFVSEFTLSYKVRNERNEVEDRIEQRSVIGWCDVFAKPGSWRSIRSKCVWCKTVDLGGGEVQLRVAFRHEFFAQVKADRRLIEPGSNTFARRAQRYGIGRPGGQKDRPGGEWALLLDDAFVNDLMATLPDEVGSCTTSKVQPDGSDGVQP